MMSEENELKQICPLFTIAMAILCERGIHEDKDPDIECKGIKCGIYDPNFRACGLITRQLTS